MSDSPTELKIKIKKYLGSSKIYWQGNSARIALPIGATEKLQLKRGVGSLFKVQGSEENFLFFETDIGILLKPIDEDTEKKLKDVFKFNDLSKLSEEDLKLLFP